MAQFHAWWRVGLTAVLALTALAGCAAPQSSDVDQRSALADGQASDAEYRLAMEATRHCMAERGWDVSEIRANPDGVLLTFLVKTEEGGPDPAADFSDCNSTYRDSIEQVYRQQHMLTGAEQEAALDSLFQCFADIPVDSVLRSDGSKALLRKAREQYPDNIQSPQFLEALDCISSHRWAITDQADPD